MCVCVCVCTYVDGEQAGHAVQVVGFEGHGQHFGDDFALGPIHAKFLHQFLQVLCGSFTNSVHCVQNQGEHALCQQGNNKGKEI